MAPTKMAAEENSEKTCRKKYQEKDSRRIRRSIKKLRAEMEEIRAEVELIRRRQKHFKGKSVFQGDKAEMGRPWTNMKPAKKTGPDGTAAKHRELLKVGIKEIDSRKHQKRLHFKLRKEKTTLQRMEAKAAQAKAGTSNMREETAAMVEAMDYKKAELELLRMLHIHLFNEMVLLSETEEEGMEILLS